MRKQKDIMRSLWLAYVAGDEKAFDRVSLRTFSAHAENVDAVYVGKVYAIEEVEFEGEE